MQPSASGKLMVQRISDVYVVEFLETNILDQVAIERIKEELMDLITQSGSAKMIISFENVKHVSSAMLGTLMAVNKKVKQEKGELRLAAINKQLMEVFKLTRLDKVLKIFKTSQEALAKFAT